MRDTVKELMLQATVEELEEIRHYINLTIEGKCNRCGRPLSVIQYLDFANLPEGKVCMSCMESN